jgi:hypothetical protein
MKLFEDWYKIRKGGLLTINKDFNNRWFQIILLMMMTLVGLLFSSENRYMRLAASAILVYWFTTYIATRFLAIVWAALIIGLFHVHLAREIKKGINEKSAQ